METGELTKRLEEAINIVPTGELRNLLCDVNITLLTLTKNKHVLIKDKNGKEIHEGDTQYEEEKLYTEEEAQALVFSAYNLRTRDNSIRSTESLKEWFNSKKK